MLNVNFINFNFNIKKSETKTPLYRNKFVSDTFVRVSFSGNSERSPESIMKEREYYFKNSPRYKRYYKEAKRRGLFEVIPSRGKKQLTVKEIDFLAQFKDRKRVDLLKSNGLLEYIPEREDKQFDIWDYSPLIALGKKGVSIANKYNLLRNKNLNGDGIFGFVENLDEKHLNYFYKNGYLNDVKYDSVESNAMLKKLKDKDILHFKKRGLRLNAEGIYQALLSDKDYKKYKERKIDKLSDDVSIQKEYMKLSDRQFDNIKKRKIDINLPYAVEIAKFTDRQYSLYEKFKNTVPEWRLADIFSHADEDKDKIGLYDLLSEGKISLKTFARINTALNEEGVDLIPEIYSDLKLLKENKSLIKDFKEGSSEKEIFKKTNPGDVVQIGENMYINDGESLYLWNMTRKNFNKLFPPVERFISSQGDLGDCYLVSVLQKLMQNPYSRPYLYKMFSVKNNDIICEMDSYFPTVFKDGKIKMVPWLHLKGCLGFRMIEQSYANFESQFFYKKRILKNKMKDIGNGGLTDNIMDLFLDLDKQRGEAYIGNPDVHEEVPFSISIPFSYIDDAGFLLRDLANDKRYLLNFSISDPLMNEEIFAKYNLIANHAYSISRYNSKKDEIYIINPHNSIKEQKLPVSDLSNFFGQVTITKLYPVEKGDKNSIVNLRKKMPQDFVKRLEKIAKELSEFEKKMEQLKIKFKKELEQEILEIRRNSKNKE